MIGLDTNILVRYLTQDDPDQAVRANRLIEDHCTRDAPGHIAIVVLCELVWVLRGAYGLDKDRIVEVLEGLLITAELAIEDDSVAYQALTAYRMGSADFADYVIAYRNQAAGCEATYSFDRKLVGQGPVREP